MSAIFPARTGIDRSIGRMLKFQERSHLERLQPNSVFHEGEDLVSRGRMGNRHPAFRCSRRPVGQIGKSPELTQAGGGELPNPFKITLDQIFEFDHWRYESVIARHIY